MAIKTYNTKDVTTVVRMTANGETATNFIAKSIQLTDGEPGELLLEIKGESGVNIFVKFIK